MQFDYRRPERAQIRSFETSPTQAFSAVYGYSMPRTVLFIGDSHTRARLGSSYVEKLQHMLQNSDLQLLKFGVDGEPTESIARRVGPILKKHPRPAAVILLAGTNDCIAQEHSTMQWMYRKGFKTTRPCSLDYALGNMKQMIEHVRKEAPDAKVMPLQSPAEQQMFVHWP